MLVYHVSPSGRRPSIQTDGLRLGTRDGPYIFCFDNLGTAKKARAEGWPGRHDLDIWMVDADGYILSPDPAPNWELMAGDHAQPWNARSFRLDRAVPADRVRRVVRT